MAAIQGIGHTGSMTALKEFIAGAEKTPANQAAR